MPRSSLTHKEIETMRMDLCHAALRLFKEQGYEAVSFRKLAALTGSSHTQPYRYFRNKEQLFAAVRVDCFRRFAGLIQQYDLEGATPAARLQSIYAAVVEYVCTEPAEYQLMFSMEQPPLQGYSDLLAARRQAFDYLVMVVQDAIDQGRMTGDARIIMHTAWNAVHGLFSLHTAGQLVHGCDLDELVQPLLHRVLSPLFDAQPAVIHTPSVACN